MTFADTAKRRMELRRKLGDSTISRIQEQDAQRMYLQAACNEIMWRVRMCRHSAGALK